MPYLPRPVRFSDTPRWQSWLTTDQRPFANRPDVLVYETDELKSPVRISGVPVADLYAATSGTDSDWVVKLIDVYPDMLAARPEMSGYRAAHLDGYFSRPLSRQLSSIPPRYRRTSRSVIASR